MQLSNAPWKGVSLSRAGLRPPSDSDPRPTINLFEQWEEGAHMPKVANARDYSFPKSLVVPFTWMYASRSLTLSDAVNYVSQHEEKDAWGQASHISLVAGINYPSQPERSPSSHLSDPLTYWWGVTLCPPELNDVSLAEGVVILMRYAAIKETHLNTDSAKCRSLHWQMYWSFRARGRSALQNQLRTQMPISTRRLLKEATLCSLRAMIRWICLLLKCSMVCGFPSELKEPILFLRVHGLEIQRRKSETSQVCRRGNPMSIKGKVSPLQRLLRRHTS